MTQKDEPPTLDGVQYATGEEWRTITSNPGNNEMARPEQKWGLVADVSGNESKIRCCKEQYCVGTWNVRSMNQGKLAVVKQEMASVNINILGICELKWMGMENLIQMTLISTAVGKNLLEEIKKPS